MRVAITGMSAWSCYGHGVDPFLAAVRAGERGLREVDRFDTDDPWFKTRRAFLADLGRDTLGQEAWRRAVETAVEVAARLPPHPGVVAVFNGTTHGSNGPLAYMREPDPTLLSSSAAETARRIAQRIGARGPNVTLNTACSSGLNAIGQAAELVADGLADAAIAGGNDAVSYLTFLGFNSLGALTHDGCRPLDAERDGLSLGDGAAYLLLERPEAAAARGAPILGYVTGYASAGEGHHPPAPDPAGPGALRVRPRPRQGRAQDGRPADLAWVCAHGTGTHANDGAELTAIDTIAARHGARPEVRALKSWLGHTLGAAGALEAVLALGLAHRRYSAPTWGLREPAVPTEYLRLPTEGRRLERVPALLLCNAFGFGGSVAALCLRPSPAEPEQGDDP